MNRIPPGFTSRIDLRRLDRPSRRLLGAGYLFAAAMLVTLALIWHAPPRVALAPEKPDRIMHADIIELPSRPESEPFRMSPPKRAHGMARPERLPAMPILPEGRLKSPGIAGTPEPSPSFEYPSGTALSAPEEPDSTRFAPVEPGVADNGIGGRVPEGGINLTDELIDAGTLDNGRDKALLIRDPGDMRNVKGYVHIPITVRGNMMSPAYETRNAVPGLVEAAYRYTGITVKIDRTVFLNSPELRKYPFVYISAGSYFDFTPDEAQGLRRYLDEGGFAVLEPYGPAAAPCGWPQSAPPMMQLMEEAFNGKLQRTSREAELKDMTRKVQEKLGEPVKLLLIPNTHELFKSFFDLDISAGDHLPHFKNKCPTQPGNYLEGIWLQQRLTLVYSEKAYGKAWSNVSNLRMGMNMLVYALSQPGGKTRQLADNSSVTSQQSRTWWDIGSRMQYLNEEKSSLNPKFRIKKP